MTIRIAIAGLALTAMVVAPVAAQKRGADVGKTPPQVQRLIGCRSIADPMQRLACFETETTALEQAMASKDLVMIDRERAREAKKSLFGFSVPSFGGLFGDSEDDVKEISSTIAAIESNQDGGWLLRLADGSVWSQTDGRNVGSRPKKGQKVTVRRAAMGSFVATVEGRVGVKVKRVG